MGRVGAAVYYVHTEMRRLGVSTLDELYEVCDANEVLLAAARHAHFDVDMSTTHGLNRTITILNDIINGLEESVVK